MKRKLWRRMGIVLAVFTLTLSGCMAVNIEEAVDGVQKPVATEVPKAVDAPKIPEVTEVPETTEMPEITQAPEVPLEAEQSETDSPENQAVEEIIRAAYENCKDIYDGIYPEAIKAMTICAATEEYISVNIAADETLSPTDYFHMELACENGQWIVTEFVELCSKNGPYGEEYTSLEPLACDSVEFPADTVVPLAMGTTVSVDLNGDGIQELVQVSFGSVCTMQTEGEDVRGNAYHRE